MSWWTGLASKAEDLLNRVDQSAAVALNTDNKDLSVPGQGYAPEAKGWRPASEYRDAMKAATGENAWYYGGPSKKTQLRKSPPLTQQQTQTQPGSKSQSRVSVKSQSGHEGDEDLFDFLNSSSASDKHVKERPRSAMASKPSHSRRSSASSTKSESIIDLSYYDETDSYQPSNRNRRGSEERSGEEHVAPLVANMETSEETRSDTESFYAALKNDFSRTEIRRPNSVTPLVAQEVETQAPLPEVDSPPPGVSATPTEPADTPHDDSAHCVYEDHAYNEWTEAELVDLGDTPVKAPPVVEEQYQNSSVSETMRYEAPPDVMTSSFQNPYADPVPSDLLEPESEPEPESPPTPPLITDEETVALRQKVSSLELENKLLRSEVASLNMEIVAVVQREKATREDLSGLSGQLEQLDRIQATVRELESREMDYRESLKAKDHQIGVLRVRLEEMDNEIAGKNQAVNLLESERERLLRDQSDSVGAQNQTLENMHAKLAETEMGFRREQETLRQVQREVIDRQTKADDDQRNLAEQLQVFHKKLQDEKNKNVELNNQIRIERQTAETVRQELTSYKEKAARILQSKDKLIASLRDGGAASPDMTSSTTSSVSSELEEVRQEREMYKEELQVMSVNMDRLRLDMTDVELQQQTDNEEARESIDNLEEQLDSEKRKRDECDQEILKQKQELRYAHEEILQQRINYQKQVCDKDTEIERLSGQLSSKLNTNTSQAELENRLRALTESLIQKQTMLENCSTEKSSLALQLERMERRFRDNESLRSQAATAHVNMADDSDSMRNRLPLFLNETTYDTHVTRGMKRAANTLDAFSIRLGVFLRRYPIARIFIIMYMVLLHLWVSVVLVTYQPEIHGNDFSPRAPDSRREH